MLALTQKTGYALIAMSHLAGLEDGQVACSRGIAESCGAAVSLMMNVLKELAAAGYVESVRGAHGGYRLVKSPEEINLADLIEVMEGPIRLAECMNDQADDNAECTCQAMARCPVTDPVHRAQRKLSDFLRKVTLSELLDGEPVLPIDQKR